MSSDENEISLSERDNLLRSLQALQEDMEKACILKDRIAKLVRQFAKTDPMYTDHHDQVMIHSILQLLQNGNVYEGKRDLELSLRLPKELWEKIYDFYEPFYD